MGVYKHLLGQPIFKGVGLQKKHTFCMILAKIQTLFYLYK